MLIRRTWSNPFWGAHRATRKPKTSVASWLLGENPWTRSRSRACSICKTWPWHSTTTWQRPAVTGPAEPAPTMELQIKSASLLQMPLIRLFCASPIHLTVPAKSSWRAISGAWMQCNPLLLMLFAWLVDSFTVVIQTAGLISLVLADITQEAHVRLIDVFSVLYAYNIRSKAWCATWEALFGGFVGFGYILMSQIYSHNLLNISFKLFFFSK